MKERTNLFGRRITTSLQFEHVNEKRRVKLNVSGWAVLILAIVVIVVVITKTA